jgi:hypothetical protein
MVARKEEGFNGKPYWCVPVFSSIALISEKSTMSENDNALRMQEVIHKLVDDD